MKSKGKLNLTIEYVDEKNHKNKSIHLLFSLGMGILVAAGIFAGFFQNFLLEFNWNLGSFLNSLREKKALEDPLVYQKFVDNGQGSLVFIIGMILLFSLMTILVTSLFMTKRKVLARAAIWMGVSVLLFLLALPLGVNGKIENKVNHWHDGVTEKIEEWKYSSPTDPMTFGDFSQLDGLREGKGKAMTLTMSNPGPIYLKGFTGEVYTGKGWRSLTGTELLEENQTFLSLYAEDFQNQKLLASGYEMTHKEKEKNQIKITLEGANSKFLYVPYELKGGEPKSKRYIGGANLRPLKDSEGKAYSLDALGYLTDQTYENKVALKQYQEKNRDALFFKTEYAYRKFAEKMYLTIPKGLKSKLNALTDSYRTKPRKKVKEEILLTLKEFKYDENVTYEESQGDFMEEFFREKEGYSLHFATAAALMFRACNIPARFVEGYIITPEDVEKKKSGEEIPIDQSHYHAWAEYYEEGLGWIPFEATPEYLGLMPSEVKVPEKDQPDLQGNQGKNQLDIPPKANNIITQEAEINTFWAMISGILILLLCGLLFLLIWRLSHRKFRGYSKKDFKAEDDRLAIMAMMAYMEHLQRKRKEKEIPKRAVTLYKEARYSNHKMKREDRDEMRQMLESMRGKK